MGSTDHDEFGDATSRPPAEPAPVWTATPPSRPARRRWPWIVALVIAVAATAVSAGIALEQREVAAQWRDRAWALEIQRDDALGRGAALQTQLDDVARALDTSEIDVERLEGRILELADEKAQAEDTATTVQVERDVFVDLSERVTAATDALDDCIDRLFALQASSVDAFNRSATGEPVDVEPLNRQAQETTTFCNSARTAAAQASAAADRLLGP